MTGLTEGLVCPAPIGTTDRVLLGHGSGGKLSAALIREHFLPRFSNPILAELGDGAVFPLGGVDLVMSTDTFVVSPLEFPGGNIGDLALNGTVNDLAMMGATPRFLTTGFVLEEGLSIDLLDRVLASMATAAAEAGVSLITGDTKVVERGKADGIYINTTGLGLRPPGFAPRPGRVAPGDVLVVSGPLGRHGMAIMASREGLRFESDITSDTACLVPLVESLRLGLGEAVRALRDPTRGGLASAVNEIATASGVGVVLDQGTIRIPPDVEAACEMLGLDPLYVANEGVLAAFVSPDRADEAVALLRSHRIGAEAFVAGRAVKDHPGLVVLKTGLGATRIVDLLPGDQLPRIC